MAPAKQTITIELDLGPSWEHDEDGDLIPVDNDNFDQRILDAVVDRVMKRRDYSTDQALSKSITDQVNEVVAERIGILMQQPIQRYASTSYYDSTPKPVGDPIILADLVREKVGALLAAPLPSRDSFSREQTLGTIMQSVVEDQLKKALKPVIDDAKKAINEQTVQVARDAVIKALVPDVTVKR